MSILELHTDGHCTDMSNPVSAVELACLCLQDECSMSSEEFDMSDPTWISAERHAALSDLNNPSSAERMHSPQNAHKDEDGKKSAAFCLIGEFKPFRISRRQMEQSWIICLKYL